MRWLGVTIGLLAATLSLAVWVYMRDRGAPGWRLAEHPIAQGDATAALAAVDGGGCRSDCAVELLERRQSGRWFARLTVRGKTQCMEIELDTFAVSSRLGLSGVQPSRCPVG